MITTLASWDYYLSLLYVLDSNNLPEVYLAEQFLFTSSVVCSFQFVTVFLGQYYTSGRGQVLVRHLTSECVLFSGPHISRWCLLMDLEITPCDRIVLLHCWSITYFSRIWVCVFYGLVLSLGSSPGLPWMRLFFPLLFPGNYALNVFGVATFCRVAFLVSHTFQLSCHPLPVWRLEALPLLFEIVCSFWSLMSLAASLGVLST